MTAATSKPCRGPCDKALPLQAFGPQKGGLHGKASWCRACAAERAKSRRVVQPITEEQREAARVRAREWSAANKDQKAATTKAWYLQDYAKNPDKYRLRAFAWTTVNPHKVLEIGRRWHRLHRTESRAASRRWREQNPEAYSAAQKRWRVENADYWRGRAEVIAAGDLTWDQWVETLGYFGSACAYCLRSDVPMTMDHMDPISKGGVHTQSNVIPACQSCNSRKGARSIFSMLSLQRTTLPTDLDQT